MDKKTAERARAELKHALDALGDGSGHEEWGPGPLGAKLWERSTHAASAWDSAIVAIMRLMPYGSSRMDYDAGANRYRLKAAYKQRCISAMRRVAPVMLEVILESAE